MLRRYRIRFYDQGTEPHHDRLVVMALDMDAGHGLAASNAQLTGQLVAMAEAAGLRERDLHRCWLTVTDEANDKVVYTHFPPSIGL